MSSGRRWLSFLALWSIAMDEVNWDDEARNLLRSQLARSGVSYKVLAARLGAIGVQDNEAAIASRISRGKFSFAFFLQCMRALGVSQVRLVD